MKQHDEDKQVIAHNQEIKNLKDKVANLVGYYELDQEIMEPIIDSIVTAATEVRELEQFERLMDDKTQQVIAARNFIEELRDPVISFVKKRIRRERYTDVWWSQTRKQLKQAVRKDVNLGFRKWLQLYSSALIDWRLDVCKKMIHEDYAFPSNIPTYRSYFRKGTETLLNQNYETALGMLNFLYVKLKKYQISVEHLITQGLLLVLIGRIYLHKLSKFEKAKLRFEKAKKLVPNDGRPYAALGDYYFISAEIEDASINFMQAIELSPDEPDGYVGMGLIAESQKEWAEAEDWYHQAIESIVDKSRIEMYLGKLIFSVSGNLYIALAKSLLNQNKPEEALSAAKQAVDIGLKDGSSYPDRVAFKIKGKIYEALNQKNEASQAYLESGKRYCWIGDFSAAEELLRKSKDLNSELAECYWYLSETLRIYSHTKESPIKFNMLRDALDNWNNGESLQLPSDLIWPYIAKALILESFSDLQPDKFLSRHETAVLIERALILNETVPQWWSFLIRIYRSLQMHANALMVANMAMKYGNKNVEVLDETVAVLANLGVYDKTLELIDQRLELKESSWAEGVKAFVLFANELYEEALEQIDLVIEEDPSNVWNLGLRANCLQMLERKTEALVTFKEILKSENEESLSNLLEYGQAAYKLSATPSENQMLQKAKNYAQLALENETISKCDAHALLGQVYLKQGDIEKAENELRKSIDVARRRPEITELLNIIIKELEQESQKWQHRESVQNLLDKIRSLAKVRLAELYIPSGKELENIELLIPFVEKELENKLSILKKKDQNGSRGWIAINVALIRLFTITKNWVALAETYELLLNHQDTFPEVKQSLEKTTSQLQGSGKLLLSKGDPSAAFEEFQNAITFAKLERNSITQATLLVQAGYACFASNRSEAAYTFWTTAFNLYRASGDQAPGSTAGKSCLALIQRMKDFWLLKNELESRSSRFSPDDLISMDLNDMNSELDGYLEHKYQLSVKSSEAGGGSGEEYYPLVTPIVVEVSTNFSHEEINEDSILLKTYLPNMRKGLLRATGVNVPGVRIRINDYLSTGDYLIILEEVPNVMGSLKTGMYFCPTSVSRLLALGIPETEMSEAIHPITNNPGSWVNPEYEYIFKENELDYWADPILYMVHHLESVLRANLAIFIDEQSVENFLETWSRDLEGAALVADVFLDDISKTRFSKVLRSLLSERVPISRWQNILKVLYDTGLPCDDVHNVVRTIRLGLKSDLPGNGKGDFCISVPEDVEREVASGLSIQNNKYLFAMLPEKTQNVLTKIREFVQSKDYNNLVLVTRDSNLRPFMRRLLELEFPNVMVIAQEELVSLD